MNKIKKKSGYIYMYIYVCMYIYKHICVYTIHNINYTLNAVLLYIYNRLESIKGEFVQHM